jgi:hypothetical protein
MHWHHLSLYLIACAISPASAACPDYTTYSTESHPPLSAGEYKLAYQRPDSACRTFSLPEVEDTIQQMSSVIKDPDLYRLFENTYPNTLDTTISWKGFASGTDEEVPAVYLMWWAIAKRPKAYIHRHGRHRRDVAAG